MRNVILALDAGGQSFKFCIIDFKSLDILTEVVFNNINAHGTKYELLGYFADVVRKGKEIAEKCNYSIKIFAISAPGPLDFHMGISLMDHKWPNIKNINIKDFLYSNILSKEIPIVFCHDSNSLLWGQIALGYTKNSTCIAGYILGTGLGFGIIENGIMQNNILGSPKFKLFLKPYRDSILENYVASNGIPKLYSEFLGEDTNLNAKQIGDLAKINDEIAIKTYKKIGQILAEESLEFFQDYSVDCIVFGGRISKSFDIFIPAFKKILNKNNLDIPLIYRSEATETLSMQGVSYYAKKLYMEKELC